MTGVLIVLLIVIVASMSKAKRLKQSRGVKK
jgi:hypothetical protein